jgi:hypothetical protein
VTHVIPNMIVTDSQAQRERPGSQAVPMVVAIQMRPESVP